MKPIERIPIVEQVMNNLNEYIIENKLVRGNKMPTEKEVCEMFNVGRSTAREAYRMMEALNILEVRRGKGIFFTGLLGEEPQDNVVLWFKQHAQTLSDYMEVRTAIETMSIRLAIDRATEKDILTLEEIHTSFIQSAHNKKKANMAIYDEEFHHKITAITQNALLIKIEKTIAECLIDYRTQTFTIESNILRAITSHQQIINAFRSQNIEDGVKMMYLHLKNSLYDMEQITKKEPLNSVPR